ncbi:hypothetical protein DKT77_06385 [Meridianimarinicoccus roseus]|uniref:Uncharacterized protein n=1 Tax=Meridianimarinicoccus roseus TaxID=2072018 RepID=A0A2V2LEK4_9RHOB|nr:hypothetical protein [Meridianimarinicoccus roseus]PWR03482.1 hypothetical protein DKT77_06385 [Meridianimarinicoccus roseus]
MSLRAALAAASLTGLFCAAFVLVARFVGPLLPALPVVAFSFVSGFLGSLFASYVLRRRPAERGAQDSGEIGRRKS